MEDTIRTASEIRVRAIEAEERELSRLRKASVTTMQKAIAERGINMPSAQDLINDLDQLVTERATTHGDYLKTARIAVALKRTIHAHTPAGLHECHIESLDLICTKIARILSGNAREIDHWNDIAGYAKLASKICNTKAK